MFKKVSKKYIITRVILLVMNIRCLKCKGADLSCGRSFCPIYARSQAMFKVEKNLKEDFFGESPAPFVGRFGYPKVNVGILSPTETKENTWEYDAPRHWAKENYEIQRIVDLRSSLVNSRFKSDVKDKNKLLEISQEIGMASKPVEIEINLKEKPKFRINNDSYMAPTGPNAKLKKARITENPKISSKVDKVVSDTDLKANDALLYLWDKGFDENFLSKILSVGNLGIEKNRKLVPTRWSITAADDIIGKNLLSEIKNYNETDYCSYFGSYLGNYYLVMFFPDVWSYELFEMYMPRASFNLMSDKVNYMTDYEPYEGRKTYAENCAGGFYAARVSLLQKLKKIKRQSSVLVLRMITGEYAVPLGVWVCREAVRKALTSKPIYFEDKAYMLNYAKKLIKKKFNYDINNILNKSLVLDNINKQSKLKQFIKHFN